MLAVFEVHLVKGADPSKILSKETLEETHAQVMTSDEAHKVGFQGLPPAKEGETVRYVAVNRRDSQWIHRALETNEVVGGFRMHEVDM
jgi:hypothetical protein